MALEDFTPIPKDVAGYLRQRIQDELGHRLSEFTADTEPSLQEIEALIPKGVNRVAAKIGEEICEGDDPEKQEALYADARDLAALAVAIIAERSLWPQQIGTDKSPHDAMVTEFKEDSKVLIEAVAEHCGGGGGESVGSSNAGPSYNFPCPSGVAEEIT
jgi:phosphoribosyl-ATP pyrophosphohydrolase